MNNCFRRIVSLGFLLLYFSLMSGAVPAIAALNPYPAGPAKSGAVLKAVKNAPSLSHRANVELSFSALNFRTGAKPSLESATLLLLLLHRISSQEYRTVQLASLQAELGLPPTSLIYPFHYFW